MKLSSTTSLLATVTFVVAVVAEVQGPLSHSERHEQHERLLDTSRAFEGHAQRYLENCNDIECAADLIDAELAKLTSNRVTLEGMLSPLNDMFDKVMTAETEIGNARVTRSGLELAFNIAQNLPYVGTLFKGAKTVIDQFESPLKTLDDSIESATSKCIRPWDISVTDTLTKMSSAEAAISQGMDKLVALGEFEGLQCVPEMLDNASPGAMQQLNNVKNASNELANAMKAVNSALNSLINAIKGNTWKNIKNKVNSALDLFDEIFGPLKPLTQLADLLNKKITIPWVPKFDDKPADGIPRFCPSGYKKSGTGLSCIKLCDSGYKDMTDFNCISACPSGYKELAVSCTNKYYYVRKIKSRKWNGKCSSGYSGAGLVCWKKCSSGYSSKGFALFGVCYKSCPNGMSSDPTKALCMRKYRERTVKSLQCRSGYHFIEGFCLKKCDSDEKDGRYFCYKPTTKTFTIASIGSELNKIMNKVKDLPIISDIEREITNLTKKALKFILDRLGLPNPANMKALPSMQLNTLPLSNAVNALDNIKPIDFDAINYELFDTGFDNVFKGFGFPGMLEFANCGQDPNCLFDLLGMPRLPLPSSFNIDTFFEGFTTNLNHLDWNLKKIYQLINGCKTSKDISIPVTETMAKFTNNPFETCGLNVEICEELDIDGAELAKHMRWLRNKSSGIIELFSEMYAAGESEANARRLEGRDLDGGIFATNTDNFEVSIPVFFLDFLLPAFKTFGKKSAMFDWFGFIFQFNKKQTLGSFAMVEFERSRLYYSFGKHNGRQFVRLDMRVGIQATMNIVKNKARDVILATHDMLKKHALSLDGKQCIVQPDIDSINGYKLPATTTTVCRQFNTLRNRVFDPEEWEWDGIAPTRPNYQDLQELLDDYDSDDIYWTTTQGLKDAEAAVKFMQDLYYEISAKLREVSLLGFAKNFLLNKAIDLVAQPLIRVYTGPRVSDYVLDFGILGKQSLSSNLAKVGGHVQSEVKFAIKDLAAENDYPIGEYLNGVFIGGAPAYKNRNIVTNDKARTRFGFNFGVEFLIHREWEPTPNPTESPTSFPTASPTSTVHVGYAPTGSPTEAP